MDPLKILVVEDEAMTAMLLQKIVKQLGHIFLGSMAKGEDAVLFVKKNEQMPDLILMDIQLAGEIDGIEAASRVKAAFNIPIIFATAFSNPEVIERAQKIKPNAYLIKPITRSELASAISSLIYKA